MKMKEAIAIGGKISTGNTKMPGTTFSTDSFACQVGELLSKIPGSTCSGCYARRLHKFRPKVREAHIRNLQCLIATPFDDWVEAIVSQLNHHKEKYHRWFDFGDLPSMDAFHRIVEVCRQTPEVMHWLPTREVRYVARTTNVPNLIVRISAPLVDQAPVKGWEHTSTVHAHTKPYGYSCPARHQGNNCGDCRACWNSSIKNISYEKH